MLNKMFSGYCCPPSKARTPDLVNVATVYRVLGARHPPLQQLQTGKPEAPRDLAQSLFPGGQVLGSQFLIRLQFFLNEKFGDTSWAVSF